MTNRGAGDKPGRTLPAPVVYRLDRLLLRAMKAYFVPISEARYERYLALGDEFGLGEDVVDDGNFNIWSDLD